MSFEDMSCADVMVVIDPSEVFEDISCVEALVAVNLSEVLVDKSCVDMLIAVELPIEDSLSKSEDITEEPELSMDDEIPDVLVSTDDRVESIVLDMLSGNEVSVVL